jgi:4-amino-4-deoxy-L-arabinose transferase-like glycosyltransferase
VGLIAVAGLLVRLAYVLLLRRHPTLVGDAYQFHYGANLLADGKGFIDALAYGVGVVRQTAQHPPLYTLVLALPSLVGLRSILDHQVVSCLLGVGTVVMVGLAGRHIGGERTGLLAAGVAAVYPNLWLWDGLVLSETLGLLATATVVVFAYRLWERRTMEASMLFGAVCGLAALTRAEAAFFLPAVVVPLAIVARSLPPRRRVAMVLAAGAVAAGAVAPWVGYNLTRLNRPTIGTSTDFAQTLVLANCDPAYYGASLGSRSFRCLPPTTAVGGDETDSSARYRTAAMRYIRSHVARLPVVVAAREGRAWGVYRPLQQLDLDVFFEHRNLAVAEAGYAVYWFLVLAAVPGALVLRRRGVTLTPLVAVLGTVALAVAVTFGQTRYRTSAEIVLVLLAAAWLDDAISRVREGGTTS